MKRSALIVLALALWLSACGPGVTPSPAQSPQDTAADTSAAAIVQDLVADKLAAMEAKDLARYMALIDETDEEYYIEQRNWFLIYLDAITSDFSIEVLDAMKVDNTTIVATLCQHYLYGSEKEDRAITYEEKFVQTPKGWKDADLNFVVHETAHFIIKVPPEVEARASAIGEESEKAYTSVARELGLEPQDRVTIKLYADQEMLRQSTDIRIAYLFNGWGEAGESIKMYAYRDLDGVARLVAHELVHKITLEVTDNQPSWFAEGLATYFGNQPFQGGNAFQLGRFPVEELAQPTTWLEEKDLTQLTDEKTITLYYAMSGMIIEFIVDTFGLDKLQELLTELSKYPDHDRGYDISMEPELQHRLYETFENVLGVNKDAFNQQWLAWIGSQ